MKRKSSPIVTKSASKKARPQVPEYHLTPSLTNEDGDIIWPAPKEDMQRARELILEWQAHAVSKKRTLIVPDKDADGLSSGAILRRTLILLGLPAELIVVHLLSKGNTIHSEDERKFMSDYEPSYVFVLDQGSRSGKSVVDVQHQALIIDHHHATPNSFPDGSEHVTACDSPPVATSSLLTYTLCEPLHQGVRENCDWLCIVGTHGDLGNTLKWEPPFPDMRDTFKKYTKKLLNDVVSLVNAPRRTAAFDVLSAWTALCGTSEPASVLKNPRLLTARQEVNKEVERCTHAAPKFSRDGKVAVFRIKSEAQVHPVIATRWAGHLQSKMLEIVLVANEGYLLGKVNFSCRIPRCARSRDAPIDIIQSLRAYASLTEPWKEADEPCKGDQGDLSTVTRPLLERIGGDFARGHVQASGGIVTVDEFEELMRLMRVGEKPEKSAGDEARPKKTSKAHSGQQNTLMSYLKQKS